MATDKNAKQTGPDLLGFLQATAPNFARELTLERLELVRQLSALQARNEELVEAAKLALDDLDTCTPETCEGCPKCLETVPALTAVLDGQPSPLRQRNEELVALLQELMAVWSTSFLDLAPDWAGRAVDAIAGQPSPLREENERLRLEITAAHHAADGHSVGAEKKLSLRVQGLSSLLTESKAQHDELLEAIEPLLDQAGHTTFSLEQIASALDMPGIDPSWPGAAKVLREYSAALASAAKGGAA